MGEYRQYSDDQKAVALAVLEVNQGDYSKTARQTNVPRITLKHWADGDGVSPAVSEIVQGKRGALADRFEAGIHQFIDAITPEKIELADLRTLATCAGIFTDKMRLLREQATTITNAQITDEDRLRELQELMQRLRQRQIEAQQGQVIDIEPEEETD